MDGGTAIAAAEYVFPSGLVDAVALARHFDEGAAIVLPRANESFESLARLVRGLEAELGCRAQANAYLAPSGASAFVPHHDSHDVIAVQAHGSKQWRIYEGSGPDRPTRTFDAERDQPGAERLTFTTHQGDCCYLPKGVMHDAVSEGMSLHITVGIHWPRVGEVLTTLLKRVIDERPELQRVLPVAWWLPEDDHDAAVAQIREGVSLLLDEGSIAECLRFLRDDLVATRQPLVPGQLGQLTRLDDLDAGTVVALRDPLLWEYVVDDEGPLLTCFGTDIRFPPAAATAVEALLAAGPAGTTPARLDPEISDDEALVIVRRLIREGVVEARW